VDARRVARVVPLVAARPVDRPFDYLVPDGMEVARGALVRVPFGARRVEGVVVGVAAASERGGDLRAIEAVTGAVLEAELDLAEWLADTSASTVSRALELVRPPAAPARPPERWLRAVTTDGATARQRDILRALERGPLPLARLLAETAAARETIARME
jgi:primosomal protein N'